MLRLLILVAVTFCILPNMVRAHDHAVLPDYVISKYGPPPSIPKGPLTKSAKDAVEKLVVIAVNQSSWNTSDTKAFDTLIQSKDPRLVWILADMLRFAWRSEFNVALSGAAEKILDTTFEGGKRRSKIIDRMMAWDMPSYPGYLEHKRQVFTNYVPGWEKIFVEGDIDWQFVDWGGVNIDARPYDTTDEVCNCIPAADNPEISSAAQATWLEDDDIVFGIVLNGEARAYPLRIMEVREMVNDTLGGRDLGISYCTLCGSAQAYFTDNMPGGVKRPILRTSGLLIRSNKVMYDIETHSVFDTFLGKAVTGPLAKIRLTLEQATVITAKWGNWREAHPGTTVLIEELALGRDFNLRKTRDANGPIFPIGEADPRLPVQEDVVGVIDEDGIPIAFPRAQAIASLLAGQEVATEKVRLELFAGGLRAFDAKDKNLVSHQAFWFAWSQFYPNTFLWGQ